MSMHVVTKRKNALEGKHAFFDLKLPASRDKVFPHLQVIAMVSVVDSCVPNCIWMCWYFDVPMCFMHKRVSARRRLDLDGGHRYNVSVW